MAKKKDSKYRFNLPSVITVEVDSREKRPISFPATLCILHPENPHKRFLVKVQVRKIALPCGDYRLAEYPNCCVIERKAGQRELWKNLFNPRDSVRQAKSFRKLATCEFPYMLFELTPDDILKKNPHVPDVEALLYRLGLMVAKYGFHVLWVPWRSRKTTNRTQLGMFLAHLMLSHAVRRSYEVLPEAII